MTKKLPTNTGTFVPTHPAIPFEDVLLTADEVAAWLKVAPRQLVRLGVPSLQLGHRTVRYRVGDVLVWLGQLKQAA